MTTFTNPHERIEQLMLRVEHLESALTKVHGIVAEYWAPCMGSIETLLICREAIGGDALKWRPTLERDGGK